MIQTYRKTNGAIFEAEIANGARVYIDFDRRSYTLSDLEKRSNEFVKSLKNYHRIP